MDEYMTVEELRDALSVWIEAGRGDARTNVARFDPAVNRPSISDMYSRSEYFSVKIQTKEGQ